MAVSLLCLIGIPGSGKTTLAAEITKYVQDGRGDVVSIEYDSHIDEKVYSRGEWKDSRNDLLGKIENTAVELAKTGRKSVVILDDNFYYKSMRYDVYKVARKLHVGFGQVFLNVPLEICISRNQSRANPLNSDTLIKMKDLLEPPEPSRNSWETFSVCCSGEGPNVEIIFDLIAKTWANPSFEEPSIEFPPQENSDLHFADLALRQIIKSVVQSTPRDQRSDVTRKLAQTKKCILEDLRTKNIRLPNESGRDAIPAYVAFLEPFMFKKDHF